MQFVLKAQKLHLFQALKPLLETLKYLNCGMNKKPIIYLTQELRDTETQKKLWETFYNKLVDLFFVEHIPEEQQHTNYRSSDILLLRIIKK